MKDYNLFQEFLDKLEIVTPNRRRKADKIAFMGKKGDENIHAWDDEVGNANFRTDASVLCYYVETQKIEWKCVYHNTKGYYIKFHNKNVYIDLSDNQEVKFIS